MASCRRQVDRSFANSEVVLMSLNISEHYHLGDAPTEEDGRRLNLYRCRLNYLEDVIGGV